VALRLEWRIAHRVRPHRGADGLAQRLDGPTARLPGVGAVAGQERGLQFRMRVPLLHGQPAQVGGGGSERETAEVDDAQLAVLAEPVPRLPVPVRGHHRDRVRAMLGEPSAGRPLGGRIDQVPRVEPPQRARRGAGLVVLVPAAPVAVQQPKRGAGLLVDVRGVLCRGALDQHPGLVFQDHDARLPAPMQQFPGQPGGDQPAGVSTVRDELASDVVVRSPGTLDDDLAASRPDVQHLGVELAPRQIRQQHRRPEPRPDEPRLPDRKQSVVPCPHGSKDYQRCRGPGPVKLLR
jgi:hypothetical protein